MEELLLQRTKDNTKKFTLQGINTYGKIIDIYDGDSIKCIIPLFNDYFIFDIRLNGIDTCEIHSTNDILRKKALEARKKVLDILDPDNNVDKNASKKEIQEYLSKSNVIAWVKCYDFDKYGRIMADMYKHKESKSISDILLEQKLAYQYQGNTKLTEEEQLLLW
jgi:endonuclease YncB( thermonuclease family)